MTQFQTKIIDYLERNGYCTPALEREEFLEIVMSNNTDSEIARDANVFVLWAIAKNIETMDLTKPSIVNTRAYFLSRFHVFINDTLIESKKALS
jgi:hypothetical protein